MNKRQRLFVTEYLKDFNATQAAIRAGYSQRTAGQGGHELLKNPHVRSEIDRLYQEAIGPKEKIVKDVLDTLNEIITTGDKNSDRVAAAKVLAQHVGMLTDKVEVSGKDGEPIVFRVVDANSQGD